MDNEKKPQSGYSRTLSFLVIGIYAWITTVSFGLVLFDIVYSNLVPEVTATFSEAADFLLLIGAVTVLAGIGAVTLSWKLKIVRCLLIVSLFIIVFKLFMPVLFLQNAQTVQEFSAGPWIRLITSGLISALAFISLYKYSRHE